MRTRACTLLMTTFAWACAQEAAGGRPKSRVALIGELRERKLAQPILSDTGGKKFTRFLSRVSDLADLPAGVQITPGGMPARSGLAVGLSYIQRDFLSTGVTLQASIAGSARRFVATHVSLKVRAFDVFASYRRFPSLDYYGQGSGSDRTGRADYLRQDASIGAGVSVRPSRIFSFGGNGRVFYLTTAPGSDDEFASVSQVYGRTGAPGLGVNPMFLVSAAFAELDNRVFRGGPKSGGLYRMQAARYFSRGRYSFTQFDGSGQHYFPLLNETKVIAVRARLSVSRADSGSVVPFYLQPTLGGPRTLRGYRAYRFHADNALLMTAEYRWEVARGVDMAVFTDAGNVFSAWKELRTEALKKTYGLGLRLRRLRDVFLRLDAGVSREGFHAWLTFDDAF